MFKGIIFFSLLFLFLTSVYALNYLSPYADWTIYYSVSDTPPTVTDLNQPVIDSTVSGTTSVIALVSDLTNDDINCNFYIFYYDTTLSGYALNNKVTDGVCSFDFNTELLYDGFYYASVHAFETENPSYSSDFNQSGTWKILNGNTRPTVEQQEPDRYVAPYDKRVIDSNRYFSLDDSRASDEDRYYASYDQRSEKAEFSSGSGTTALVNIAQKDFISTETILLYLTLGVIITVIIVYFFWGRR